MLLSFVDGVLVGPANNQFTLQLSEAVTCFVKTLDSTTISRQQTFRVTNDQEVGTFSIVILVDDEWKRRTYRVTECREWHDYLIHSHCSVQVHSFLFTVFSELPNELPIIADGVPVVITRNQYNGSCCPTILPYVGKRGSVYSYHDGTYLVYFHDRGFERFFACEVEVCE